MSKLASIEQFNQVLVQLQRYGQQGCEEIHFRKQNGETVPVVQEKPNWFFRLVRWIFRRDYKEFNVVQKVVSFLEENQEYLKGDDVTSIGRVLLGRITNEHELRVAERQLDALMKKVNEVAKKNGPSLPTIEEGEEVTSPKLSPEFERQGIRSQPTESPVPAPLSASPSVAPVAEGRESPVAAPVEAPKPAPVGAFPPVAPIAERREAPRAPTVMNVPDDGNCLFYAFGVGLRKKYADNPDIQAKLQWDVAPELLTGDLSKAKELLKTPGDRLRAQAAAYLEAEQRLEEGQRDFRIQMALFEGLESHSSVANRKIRDEEGMIKLIETEIRTLSREVQTDDVKAQLQQKNDQLKAIRESIASQKNSLLPEGDYNGYIQATKQDHVYCGIAQILALSKEYQIPVCVIYDYGTTHARPETYNAECNDGRVSPLPALTIAHVNRNHFKFFND